MFPCDDIDVRDAGDESEGEDRSVLGGEGGSMNEFWYTFEEWAFGTKYRNSSGGGVRPCISPYIDCTGYISSVGSRACDWDSGKLEDSGSSLITARLYS